MSNEEYNKRLIQKWYKGEITSRKLFQLFRPTGNTYKPVEVC